MARLRAAGAIVLGVGNTPGSVLLARDQQQDLRPDVERLRRDPHGGRFVRRRRRDRRSGGAPSRSARTWAGRSGCRRSSTAIFGHLPSPGLVPITGHFPMPSGEFRRTLYVGPLTRRAEDLMPVLRIIAGPDGEDPNTAEMPLGDPGAVASAVCACCVSADSSTVPLRPVITSARSSARLAVLEDAGATVERGVAEAACGAALAQFAAVACQRDGPVRVVVGHHRADDGRASGRTAADRHRAGAGAAAVEAAPVRVVAHARRAAAGRRRPPRVRRTGRDDRRRRAALPAVPADRAEAPHDARRSRGSRRTPRSSTCSGCR